MLPLELAHTGSAPAMEQVGRELMVIVLLLLMVHPDLVFVIVSVNDAPAPAV